MEDFTIVKKLAQGGQGATMLVQRASGSDTMVLKQCKCENLKEANDALKESKTLQRLKHRSIVQYNDVFLAEEGQYLIICTLMEYCAGGDLAVYMNNCRHENRRIPERTVLQWTVDMMMGLDYLHNAKIVHRDMKPLNVFLTSPVRGNLKIGDFGLASTSKSEKQTSKVGTPCYLSPEILQNDSYGPAVDVWGAGCIMLEMVTFAFLWERKGMLSVQVLSRRVTYEDIPGDHSRALKDIVIAMLEKEPDDRPNASEVVKRCRALLDRGSGGGQSGEAGGGEMGLGFGHLAQGLEAIWRVGSGTGSPASGDRGYNGAQAQGDAGKTTPDKYAGKVAEFRRKTPAQAARRPSGGPLPSEGAGPSPQHGGAPSGRSAKAGQRPPRDLASERATPLNVKRALRKTNLERYVRLVEEQELYGDVLQNITDKELQRECSVHDAGDRAALLDVFRNLLLHGPAYFDKDVHGPEEASPGKAKKTPAASEAPPPVDDRDRLRRRERAAGSRTSGTEVGAWLGKIGLGKYEAAFEANGLCDLPSIAALEPAELKALGVKGRRENPYGPEETTSDLEVLLEALNGLRVVLSAQGEGAQRARRRGSALASRVGDDNEDERLFQQALQESLAEYESSTSASGSAPSSRNTASNPGTANSFTATAPGSLDNDASPAGSGSGGARRGGKDRDKRGKGQVGASVGLAKVRGMLDVCALSSPGKGAVRAYCVLKGNRLKFWWGNEARDDNLDPANKEIIMDGKCVDAAQEAGGRLSSKTLFIRRSMFGVAHDDVLLTVLAESTFIEWLQRLQASAYLFSMGAPSLHSPVGAIVVRVLSIPNASALFQVALPPCLAPCRRVARLSVA